MSLVLFTSFILFNLGLFGLFSVRKHFLLMLIAIEILLLSININFLIFAVFLDDFLGQIYVLLILTVAAAETALGLALLVIFFRLRGGISIELLSLLKSDILLFTSILILYIVYIEFALDPWPIIFEDLMLNTDEPVKILHNAQIFIPSDSTLILHNDPSGVPSDPSEVPSNSSGVPSDPSLIPQKDFSYLTYFSNLADSILNYIWTYLTDSWSELPLDTDVKTREAQEFADYLEEKKENERENYKMEKFQEMIYKEDRERATIFREELPFSEGLPEEENE